MWKFLFSLCVSGTLLAQTELVATASLAAGTPQLVLSGRNVIDTVVLVGGTTAASIKFYDAGNTSTNVVRAAYTNVVSYSTNYSTVLTNELGFVYTNSFSGLYTSYVLTGASTNERPAIATLIAPANTTRTVSMRKILANGLLALSTQAANIEVYYVKNP